jgi:hypothetical protein
VEHRMIAAVRRYLCMGASPCCWRKGRYEIGGATYVTSITRQIRTMKMCERVQSRLMLARRQLPEPFCGGCIQALNGSNPRRVT